MATDRELAPRQVLHAHTRGQEAAPGGNGGVDTARLCHRPAFESRRIGICHFGVNSREGCAYSPNAKPQTRMSLTKCSTTSKKPRLHSRLKECLVMKRGGLPDWNSGT